MAIEPRTIEELLARYEYEPSLKDVYVEGLADRTILEYAFSYLPTGDRIVVYDIASVVVPADLVVSLGLRVGNKGRLIALAAELDRQSTRDLVESVACLADRDVDELLGRLREYRLLIYTSALSLDSSLVSETAIGKFLLLVVLGFPQSAGELMNQLLPILNERVLHRAAAEQLDLAVEPPAVSGSCVYASGSIVFDKNGCIDRHLTKASAVGRRSEFLVAVEERRNVVESDPERHVHADDLFDLLRFSVHRVKPNVLPDRKRFRRFMSGHFERSDILSLPEVQEIARRFRLPHPSPT
jgi:hypothetical protein